MKKKGKGFSSMAAALSSALQSIGAANMLNFVRVEEEWGRIVGAKLSEVSRPAKLQNRTLTVWVREPVWADSMMYLKGDITGKVNRVLGKDVIDSIRIVTRYDFGEAGADRDAGGRAGERADTREEEIPASALEEVEKALEPVGDSQLRSILKRVMLKNMKARQEWPRKK